jgi:hypothetical protein
VILFTAASIAAPLFVIVVVLVLIPWLLWGFSITTERLHDRDRSAWWLLVFYLVPGVLHPGADGFCAHDLGICRNRLPARYRRPEQIWARPVGKKQTTGLNGATPKRKKARWP